MSDDKQMTAQALRPDQNELKEATLQALGKRVDEKELQEFLAKASSDSAPDPIGATASLDLAVWGKLKCDPDKKPWKYDITVWGGPAYFGTAVGFMYTAYTSWDAFFANVTSAWVQAGAAGGGFIQINWFNKDGVPVGQFNGASGGAGVAEAGGSGKWQKK